MKLRLNAEMRKELLTYARTIITFPVEEKELDAAARSVQTVARTAVAARIPHNDLLVLQKYGHAEPRKNVHLVNPVGGGYEYIDLDEPMLMSRDYTPYQVRHFDDWKKVEHWAFLKRQLETKRATLEHDYENLIKASRYFEELVEVWPEAEVMQASIEQRAGRRAISCLSAEALERVKTDIASRSEKNEA